MRRRSFVACCALAPSLLAGVACAADDFPRPELLFRASMDGTPAASFAKGASKPLAAHDITFEQGLFGQALRVSRKGALSYAFKGNALPERGGISMWIRRTNVKPAASGFEWLFSSPLPFDARKGTGALYLWAWNTTNLRGDASDPKDRAHIRRLPNDSEWHHVTFSWTPHGGQVTMDCRTGVFQGGLRYPYKMPRFGDGSTLRTADFSADKAFGSFFIGGNGHGQAFDGLIDEVTVWSAPIDDELLYRLYREGYDKAHPATDYAALVGKMSPNPYEGGRARHPGIPENLELVHRATAKEIAASPRFAERGTCRLKNFNGTPYLEAGIATFDRFAYPLAFDPKYPLHVVEIDYPDDTYRNAEYLIQDAHNPNHYNDYRMQVGVACGREYPCSGKMLTHRALYWTRDRDAALVVMTSKTNAPAALAELRIYRVKDGRLPQADVTDAPALRGWGRTFGQYWEDTAMAYALGGSRLRTEEAKLDSPERAVDQAQRLAALMKFTGQNLCAYPGVWYDGLISETGYDPRDHAPQFLSAFYEVFDREGLSFVPLLNQDARLTPAGLVTDVTSTNGTLHASMMSVRADGLVAKPSIRGPSGWNIAHPDMQAYLETEVDALLKQGARHPSFKGIGIHVKHPGLEWFGTIDGGYNDYCVSGFEKATGIKVPRNPNDPLRGKAAADWLKANARDAWIRWRCGVVTQFWSRMAKKLAAARPDLRLWVNNITDIDPIPEGFRDRDHVRRTMLEGGFDPDMLAREIPNLVLGQTYFSSDARHFAPHIWHKTPEDQAHQATMHLKREYWDFIRPAAYPLVHQHDRYFEILEGRTEHLADWFREHVWRVSAIHPAGRNALAPYVQSLIHQDVLGLTKGGFLIGTYGTEEHIARFAQYFRALPAVKLADCGGEGAVKVRRGDFDGKTYQYVVNTSGETVRAKVSFPSGSTDLVTGETFSGTVEQTLPAWDFRSYVSRPR